MTQPTDTAAIEADEELTPKQRAKQRRDALHAEAQAAAEAQEAIDIEAITDLEIEHGVSNVSVIWAAHSPGLPCAIAVRTPNPNEIKVYRAGIRIDPHPKARAPDFQKAAEDLAARCRIYPTKEQYESLCELRPGIAGQVGKAASDLATGREQDDAKS